MRIENGPGKYYLGNLQIPTGNVDKAKIWVKAWKAGKLSAQTLAREMER